MNIQIREVTSATDRARVYAFRYAVYVSEMGRVEPDADHDAGLIEEPFDRAGRVFAALDPAGQVVGTVRANFSRDTNLGLYEDWYGMRAFGDLHPRETSVVTKLMVATRYRRSSVAVRLAAACYDLGLDEGASLCFIDCNPHLCGFFSGLGFRQVFRAFRHPSYGLVHPMVLALHDREYLAAVGSPFNCPGGPLHRSVATLRELAGLPVATSSAFQLSQKG